MHEIIIKLRGQLLIFTEEIYAIIFHEVKGVIRNITAPSYVG